MFDLSMLFINYYKVQLGIDLDLSHSSARVSEDDHEITLMTNTVEVMNIIDKPIPRPPKSDSHQLAEELNAEVENTVSIKKNLNTSMGVSKNLDMSCLVAHNDQLPGTSSVISQCAAADVKESPVKEKLSPDNIINVHSDDLTDNQCRPPVAHNSKFGSSSEMSQTSHRVSQSITIVEPYQKIAQALQEWSTTETRHFLASTHLNQSNSCLKNDAYNSIEKVETSNIRSRITLPENNSNVRSTAVEGKIEIQVNT